MRRTSRAGQALGAWSLRAVLAAAIGLGMLRADERTPSAPASEPTESLWSLRPLHKPALPTALTARGPDSTNPIDAFVHARLVVEGLEPNPPADARTLLRRVYFDLTGLPPTPEEMAAFAADSSARAYERAVDRLLASPRYGERWARHWLDVVHYAETHGHDQDRIRTNAWPYRDYVVRSFNQDKPYARFVEEQIAGDVLHPERPDTIVALGLLATGPWDESSLRDIRDDTIDREIARYVDRDDIVTTVMQTFTSMTVQCARCHNHKFDPISLDEYYGLQAVFAATDKADRHFDRDPAVHRERQQLLAIKAGIDRRDAAVLSQTQDSSFRADLAAWEGSLARTIPSWTPLAPAHAASTRGSRLTALDDHSLLAQGDRPETDTYTIRIPLPSPRITAVRIEVLPDDSLPQKGPGRQDNGNFHLTDLRVFAGAQEPAQTAAARVTLANPSADFNQSGWEIAKAIDDDPKSGWGIHPSVGKPHQAIFELAHGLPEGTTELTFSLAQNHGSGHLIGRLRLSATTAPPPVRIPSLPESILKILALNPSDRSADQWIELSLYYLKEQADRKLASLPKPEVVYAGASVFVPDGSFKPAVKPREVRVLRRGDISKPGAAAAPRSLSCVEELPAIFDLADPEDEGARRAALARWITDSRNPLTWRSIVNRVWHYHFGRGLVDSPNDFGAMGGRPSHPELLDWLAATFRDDLGGSLKRLHRLIVTSATYRQSSSSAPARATGLKRSPAEEDPDNKLLWRMNRSRLDAEQLRDTVLSLAGRLDLAMGGPSMKHFVLSPGIHVTPKVDYDAFDVDSPASLRRSIYRFVFRTLPDPFMDSFDCADPSQLTAARNVSITPLQALSLLNNEFMVRQCEHLAQRLREFAPNLESQVDRLMLLALHRRPAPAEAAELVGYARQHGLPNLCRVIFNSNEFMFID